MSEVLTQVMQNKILLSAVVSWAIAQIIKVIIGLVKTRKFNIALFISSGGMPSSHTSFVVGLATAVGLTEGFNSPLFAISSVLSLVVMYDAAGVRRAAGKQAAVINILVSNLENTGIKLDKNLKELLGHSPIEVAGGAILGIVVALVLI